MYLDQADANIKVSKSLFTPEGNPTNDEGVTKIGLYLAQQGIELILKHILHDVKGEDDTKKRFRTHSISALIDYVEEISDIRIPDSLKEMSNDITSWEQSGRYPGIGMTNARSDAETVFGIYDEIREAID